MTPRTPSLTLSACALAATLFLAACGGGTSTDTVPPTVAITAAAGSAGAVTFSFVFSEDVGTSFTADDVAVTGGTKAATVTRTDATHYTLSVTPDAGATAVTATLAASKFKDVANNDNVASANSSFDVVPTTAPTMPPVRAAGDVVSIYGEAYTAVAGVNMRPNWGQSTTAAELTVAGNKIEKYGALNYEGIEFASSDVSTMTKLHVDVWTPDLASFKLSVVSDKQENAVTLTPTLYGWNSFDVDMSSYTAADKTKVIQLKIDVQPASGTMYVDNIYFYKPAAGCVAGQLCTVNFSEAATALEGFEGLVSATIENDPTNAANKVAKLVKGPTGQPWAGATVYTVASTKTLGAIDLVANPMVTIKAYSPAAGKKITLKLEVVGGANAELVATTTQANTWETLTYNATGKFTSTQIPNRISLFPEWSGTETAPASNVTYYFDDLKFNLGASGSGGGCSAGTGLAPLTAGKFASGYSGTLASGTSTECGTIGVYIGGVANSLFYDGGVAGSAGDPNFWFGYGFLPSTLSSASYIGAFVKAPNNGVANVSGYTKLNLTTWTWDDMTNKGVTGTVILTGPDVAGCTPKAQKTIAITTPVGAKTYALNLSDFTLATACGYSNTAALLAAGVSQLDVQYVGVTNLNNALNLDSGTGRAGNGMNLGKVIFGN